MKTLIAYYSSTGNTARIARLFADRLNAKGETTLRRLTPTEEPTGFASRCRSAITRKRATLDTDTDFDVSPYDMIVLGCPVWAFAPVPAMNSYLDKLNGLHGKRVVVVLTSNNKLLVNKCFKNIRNVLQGKGASSVDEIFIPDRKQGDTAFLSSSISKYL